MWEDLRQKVHGWVPLFSFKRKGRLVRDWHCHWHSLGPPLILVVCYQMSPGKQVHQNDNVCDFDFVFVPCII